MEAWTLHRWRALAVCFICVQSPPRKPSAAGVLTIKTRMAASRDVKGDRNA
jgi:hypothetical protein